MKNRVYLFICITLGVICVYSSTSFANRVVLNPERVETIKSPKESRDVRILIYFELPDKLASKNIIVDFAKLVFKAKITKARTGLLEVYPLTKSWKDQGSVTWSGTWDTCFVSDSMGQIYF